LKTVPAAALVVVFMLVKKFTKPAVAAVAVWALSCWVVIVGQALIAVPGKVTVGAWLTPFTLSVTGRETPPAPVLSGPGHCDTQRLPKVMVVESVGAMFLCALSVFV
jgi:hypothetical protein